MSALGEVFASIVRQLILTYLEKDAQGSMPVIMLKDVIIAEKMTVSLDQVTTQVEWLEEQGYVTFDKTGMPSATITPRGAEVALGHIKVSGVRHPRKM